MPLTGFDPKCHGFHFVNTFTNHPFAGVPLIGDFETYGLCGGMALAALRYYLTGKPIPNHRAPDFAPLDVPAEGTRLQAYLYQCQVDAFGPAGIASAASWLTMPWVTLEEQYRWSFSGNGCEFEKVRASIDRGLPMVIGLRTVQAGKPTLHGVLAIGYDEGPRRIYVYDSNRPGETMELRADEAAQRILYGPRGAAAAPTWSSFFRTGCDPTARPPTYFDLALSEGVAITCHLPATAGSPAVLSAVIRNVGDYPCSIHATSFLVEEPGGRATRVGSAPAGGALAPGGEKQMIHSAPALGAVRGTYRVRAGYETLGNCEMVLPVLPGAQNPASITLELRPGHAPEAVCRALRQQLEAQSARLLELADAPPADGREGVAQRRAIQQALRALAETRKQIAEAGCN